MLEPKIIENGVKAQNEVSQNYFWVSKQNAKTILAGMENQTAGFCLDKSGKLNPTPIYDANTGYCLNGVSLLCGQIIKNQNGFENNIVGTYTTFNNSNNSKLAEKKREGIPVLWTNKDGVLRFKEYYFSEQTEHPERLTELSKNIKKGHDLSKETVAVNTAEDFLPAYIAASKSGLNISVSPEVLNQFNENFKAVCENELKGKNKDLTIPKFTEYVFQADRKSIDIIKSIATEKGYAKSPAKAKSTEKAQKVAEIERDD